jgi:murein L,D-transpeptidase YcbB/YkuD
MGAVKFMFPNSLGIYLHDTPRKTLFAQETRLFSAGCVRVEDYRRLARWLWKGSDVRPAGDGADQKIDLPQPAPVYITYLTAAPVGGKVELRRDVYGRDAAVTAQMSGPRPRATDPVAAARPAIPGDITPAKAEAKGERELVLPPEEPVALRGGV